MAKQTIIIESAYHLCITKDMLEIRKEGEQTGSFRAFDDIQTLVVDNHSVHFTIPLINRLIEEHICIIFCNERHYPTGLMLDLDSNSLQGKHFRAQLESSKVLKKQLWKEIIEAKIKNQSLLLKKIGCWNKTIERYSATVKSGDNSNREAAAAKIYWRCLFGGNFKRDREGETPNNLLNYGYSILRAYTARALMSSGLLPSIGIYHRNYFNSYPLADDVMEPYRPFIDEIIIGHKWEEENKQLSQKTRKEFLEQITYNIRSNQLLQTTHSLVAKYEGERESLYFPMIQTE